MIEFSDFSEFIISQNDDRLINMDESIYYKEKEPYCGCVMVHYAVERLKQDNISCGMSEVYNYDAEESTMLDEKGITFIRHCVDNDIRTYKDAKLIMNDLLNFYAF